LCRRTFPRSSEALPPPPLRRPFPRQCLQWVARASRGRSSHCAEADGRM
jgi:hypothetical protein